MSNNLMRVYISAELSPLMSMSRRTGTSNLVSF